MSAQLEVVRLDPGRPSDRTALDEFFESTTRAVVQQTCVWGDVIRRLGPDEPWVLGCQRSGRLVGALPAYRFEGPLGAILTSVPQVGPLGGVVVGEMDAAEEIRRRLLGAFLSDARTASCDLATIVTSPFWPDADEYRSVREPDFELENVCQVLDLWDALGDDGRLRSPGAHLLRNVRRAESGALWIDEDQTRANVESWHRIHADRHRDIGARALPEKLFFAILYEAVPGGKARFFFARRAGSGEMVGGGVYVLHGQVVDALMPSVSSEHVALRPSYLLALHSMRWARSRGCRWYNWQGSPPGGGVHRFKLQWGSRDQRYSFLTWITGDARPYLESSVAEIQAGYPDHYVLPFDRIGARAGVGPSSRADAWAAREARGR